MLQYDRKEERTGVQEIRDYDPRFDVQCDFVMVYGFHDLKKRVAHWKKHGYVVHLMTGVSWGEYQDYLYGKFDGRDHHDEGQTRPNGTEINHGKDVPYMVPSVSFSHYLAENLKRAVDAGVEAIHLEEPEFWVDAGYSDAFKREWEIYYKEPWQDPQATVEGQYMASKLKQYLYKRTLDRLCAELKEYAMLKYNRFLRFYVPTHSLVNYTQWKIVSPESALVDLPTIDGYIAQIWTGTSRTANVYRGVQKERTFETAFFEYGIMQELVRDSGRKMWYLHDPVEDDPRHTWKDYRYNYYRTVAASLFQPEISTYEVAPWPSRVYTGDRPTEDGKGREPMPEAYRTNLTTVMHTLRDMQTDDTEWLTDTQQVGLLLADSAMYQRVYPVGDPYREESGTVLWSPFYGLSLPLLKQGLCVRPVQLDNVRRYASYLDAYRTLVLSYEFMKPETPDTHNALAQWVRGGGTLVYVGDGSDSFHTIRHWWNREGLNYRTPAEHLFEAMGLERQMPDGIYPVGKGRLAVMNRTPRDIAKDPGLADRYVELFARSMESAGRKFIPCASFRLRRGPYVVTAVMDETPESKPCQMKGAYADLFDENLTVLTDPVLEVGSVGLYFDLSRTDRSRPADVLAISGRMDRIRCGQRSLSFTVTGPAPMQGVARIWTRRPVREVRALCRGESVPVKWSADGQYGTTQICYPSSEKGIKISILF
ncbi:MAG: DUF4350 domain-containing protein [Clostridia bacterium]|nr:DUF4350 domain-containing protein [Clostridia bacterium]